MKHLNEEYDLSKNDYKKYHPNLIRIDEYIDHYQKNYRDFNVEIAKNNLKKKCLRKYKKKWKSIY